MDGGKLFKTASKMDEAIRCVMRVVNYQGTLSSFREYFASTARDLTYSELRSQCVDKKLDVLQDRDSIIGLAIKEMAGDLGVIRWNAVKQKKSISLQDFLKEQSTYLGVSSEDILQSELCELSEYLDGAIELGVLNNKISVAIEDIVNKIASEQSISKPHEDIIVGAVRRSCSCSFSLLVNADDIIDIFLATNSKYPFLLFATAIRDFLPVKAIQSAFKDKRFVQKVGFAVNDDKPQYGKTLDELALGFFGEHHPELYEQNLEEFISSIKVGKTCSFDIFGEIDKKSLKNIKSKFMHQMRVNELTPENIEKLSLAVIEIISKFDISSFLSVIQDFLNTVSLDRDKEYQNKLLHIVHLHNFIASKEDFIAYRGNVGSLYQLYINTLLEMDMRNYENKKNLYVQLTMLCKNMPELYDSKYIKPLLPELSSLLKASSIEQTNSRDILDLAWAVQFPVINQLKGNDVYSLWLLACHGKNLTVIDLLRDKVIDSAKIIEHCVSFIKINLTQNELRDKISEFEKTITDNTFPQSGWHNSLPAIRLDTTNLFGWLQGEIKTDTSVVPYVRFTEEDRLEHFKSNRNIDWDDESVDHSLSILFDAPGRDAKQERLCLYKSLKANKTTSDVKADVDGKYTYLYSNACKTIYVTTYAETDRLFEIARYHKVNAITFISTFSEMNEGFSKDDEHYWNHTTRKVKLFKYEQSEFMETIQRITKSAYARDSFSRINRRGVNTIKDTPRLLTKEM